MLGETALSAILVLLPIPACATVFEFVPDSIVGPATDWNMRVTVGPDFKFEGGRFAENSSYIDYGDGILSLEFHPFFQHLYTPTGLFYGGDDWVDFNFAVLGNYLTGSYHAGGSLTEQWEGFSTTGVEWLVGFGSDGNACYGRQDPTVLDDRPGYGNACRATGVFKRVEEPSSLLLLGLAAITTHYWTRRRVRPARQYRSWQGLFRQGWQGR
jgi:hypothetical protein